MISHHRHQHQPLPPGCGSWASCLPALVSTGVLPALPPLPRLRAAVEAALLQHEEEDLGRQWAQQQQQQQQGQQQGVSGEEDGAAGADPAADPPGATPPPPSAPSALLPCVPHFPASALLAAVEGCVADTAAIPPPARPAACLLVAAVAQEHYVRAHSTRARLLSARRMHLTATSGGGREAAAGAAAAGAGAAGTAGQGAGGGGGAVGAGTGQQPGCTSLPDMAPAAELTSPWAHGGGGGRGSAAAPAWQPPAPVSPPTPAPPPQKRPRLLSCQSPAPAGAVDTRMGTSGGSGDHWGMGGEAGGGEEQGDAQQRQQQPDGLVEAGGVNAGGASAGKTTATALLRGAGPVVLPPLRPYQSDAVGLVLSSWGLPLTPQLLPPGGGRGGAAAATAARERYSRLCGGWRGNWLVCAPTGSGKTRVFVEVVR